MRFQNNTTSNNNNSSIFYCFEKFASKYQMYFDCTISRIHILGCLLQYDMLHLFYIICFFLSYFFFYFIFWKSYFMYFFQKKKINFKRNFLNAIESNNSEKNFVLFTLNMNTASNVYSEIIFRKSNITCT